MINFHKNITSRFSKLPPCLVPLINVTIKMRWPVHLRTHLMKITGLGLRGERPHLYHALATKVISHQGICQELLPQNVRMATVSCSHVSKPHLDVLGYSVITVKKINFRRMRSCSFGNCTECFNDFLSFLSNKKSIK